MTIEGHAIRDAQGVRVEVSFPAPDAIALGSGTFRGWLRDGRIQWSDGATWAGAMEGRMAGWVEVRADKPKPAGEPCVFCS